MGNAKSKRMTYQCVSLNELNMINVSNTGMSSEGKATWLIEPTIMNFEFYREIDGLWTNKWGGRILDHYRPNSKRFTLSDIRSLSGIFKNLEKLKVGLDENDYYTYLEYFTSSKVVRFT